MSRRITLLAHAATVAQRQMCLADPDDEIEPVASDRLDAIRISLRRFDEGCGGPERRVAQTAAALGIDVSARPELAAWGAGDWSGRAVAEVASEDADGFGAWRSDPTAGAPGGESLIAFLARVAGWLDELDADDGRSVAIVDGSVIRAVVVRVLGAPPEAFWHLDVRPLSTSVVQRETGTWRIRSIGETPWA